MTIQKKIFVLLIFFTFLVPNAANAKLVKKVKYTRIVSLKPNITKILIQLGLQDHIVGITKFCKKPNANAKVVADYNSVQTESVMLLKPDLILSSTENSNSKDYQNLKNYNLKFLDFSTLQSFKQSVMQLGEVLKLKKQVQKKLTAYFEKIETLKTQYKNLSQKSFTLIVQRRPLMVANQDSFISQLLEAGGLKNSFGHNKVKYPVLDEEIFIREDSDYAIDISHSKDAIFLNKNVLKLDVTKILPHLNSVNALENLLSKLSIHKSQAMEF